MDESCFHRRVVLPCDGLKREQVKSRGLKDVEHLFHRGNRTLATIVCRPRRMDLDLKLPNTQTSDRIERTKLSALDIHL